MPGIVMSAPKLARPVPLSTPSGRIGRVPTTLRPALSRKLIRRSLSVAVPIPHPFPCPGLTRASTSLDYEEKDVDGRVEPRQGVYLISGSHLGATALPSPACPARPASP